MALQKVKTDEILDSARAICNLHSRYIKNAQIYSQSEVRDFFMHIINFRNKNFENFMSNT